MVGTSDSSSASVKAQSVEDRSSSLGKFEQEAGYDSAENSNALSQFTEAEIRGAWRKVDLHVLPVAVLLYLSSYIDRYVGYSAEVTC